MNIIIFGRGPGEASQAYGLASYIARQGHTIHFVLGQEVNKTFFPHTVSFFVQVIPSTSSTGHKEFTQLVKEKNPDAVIMCNSKSFFKTEFITRPAWSDIPLFTLDSNWLFSTKYPGYPFISWAERHFLNFPPRVFENGLKGQGGTFEIDSQVRKKIQVIGLVPSYEKPAPSTKEEWRKKLGIQIDEKLIFCYISGRGTVGQPWVLENLLKVVDHLRDRGKKTVITAVGKGIDGAKLAGDGYRYVDPGLLDCESFYQLIGASDLVFQHQGIATLTQAICAQVPVIVNVAFDQTKSLPNLHEWETRPFEKAGLCTVMLKSTPFALLLQTVEALLYDAHARNKMISTQQQSYQNGEAHILDSIKAILDQK